MKKEFIDPDEGVLPLLAPLLDVKRWIGMSPSTVKLLAETEPGFPKLIRVAHRITLVDVRAVADYLRAQAGQAPRMSIRDRAKEAA